MSKADDSLSLVAEARIDELGDRFEDAWRRRRPLTIEEVLVEIEEGAARRGLFQRLLEVELELLTRSGRSPDQAEYLRRFPAAGEIVAQAFRTLSEATVSEVRRPDLTLAAEERASNEASTRAKPLDDTHRGDDRATCVASGPLPARIGRFEVLSELGHGAFGAVYRARDPRLGRQVAIKVPAPDRLKTADDSQRYFREARAAALVHHPNLCSVFEVSDDPSRPFIVMAYVDGPTLASRIREDEFRDPRRCVDLIAQLAKGLAVAHDHGLVHRDIKPANILLDASGQPVLTDFGLARIDHRDDGAITREGEVLGSPAYMSPEQARGANAEIGPASDVYSLAVVLFEMLAGGRPYQGSSLEILGRLVGPDVSPRLVDVAPQIDAHLSRICERALAKEPSRRYRSMRDFARALEEWRFDASGSLAGRARRRVAWFASAALVVAAVAILIGRAATRSEDVRPGAGDVASPSTDAIGQASGDANAAASAASSDEAPPAPELDATLIAFRQGKSVLAEVDPALHAIHGRWTKEEDELRVAPDRDARIMVPYRPEGSYEFELTFTREQGEDAITLLLPAGPRRASVLLGGWAGTRSCLLLGRRVTDGENSTTVRRGPITGRRHRVVARVIFEGEWVAIDVSLDDDVLFRWRGSAQEFAMPDLVATWRSDSLGIATWMVSARIHDCRIRLLDERATIARVAEPRIDWTGTPGPGKLPMSPTDAQDLQRRWAEHLGRRVERRDEATLQLRLIPPGEFSLSPEYHVTIRRPYYLSDSEVTVGAFRRFVEATEHRTDAERSGEGGTRFLEGRGAEQDATLTWLNSGHSQAEDSPVSQISWMDAQAFCRWLSDKEGDVYRLPTEAEWEWACRAGSAGTFCYGDEEAPLRQYAWYAANSDGHPRPVKQLLPNAWGLCDMHGNLLEMTSEWLADFPRGRYVDPEGNESGDMRLSRGGNFQQAAKQCTSDGGRPWYAERGLPRWRTDIMGFRVLREIPERSIERGESPTALDSARP